MSAKEQFKPLYKRTMNVLKAREELGVMGVNDAIFIAGCQNIINRQIDRIKQYGDDAFPMSAYEVARMEEILETCEKAIAAKLEKIAFEKEVAAAEEIAVSADLEDVKVECVDNGATKTIYVTGKSEHGDVKWQGQSAQEFLDFMVYRAITALPEGDNSGFGSIFEMLPSFELISR